MSGRDLADENRRLHEMVAGLEAFSRSQEMMMRFRDDEIRRLRRPKARSLDAKAADKFARPPRFR